MLNPFPIQFLALLAYALLRVILGLVFVYLGILHYKKRHDMKYSVRMPLFFPYSFLLVLLLSATEFVVGAMFILGYYTQIAALLALPLSILMLMMYKRFSSPYIPSRMTYVLFFATSLSLFITGAGIFAFDLPI